MLQWTWELKKHEESSYLVKFPSKVELQRAVAFGGADIRGEGVPAGVRLRFEVWQEQEVGFLLPKVGSEFSGYGGSFWSSRSCGRLGLCWDPPRPWIWKPLGRATLGGCRWLF
jgi:hypothetical protein